MGPFGTLSTGTTKSSPMEHLRTRWTVPPKAADSRCRNNNSNETATMWPKANQSPNRPKTRVPSARIRRNVLWGRTSANGVNASQVRASPKTLRNAWKKSMKSRRLPLPEVRPTTSFRVTITIINMSEAISCWPVEGTLARSPMRAMSNNFYCTVL